MESQSKRNPLGEVPREIRNRFLDSRRWLKFNFRDDDIVIAAWPGPVALWATQIVGQLIFKAREGIPIYDIVPWVDQRYYPESALWSMLEEQTHRRAVRSYLPADALVFSSKAKYVYVGADGRDLVWHLYRLHSSLSPLMYEVVNESKDYDGPPLAPPTGGFREYFHAWLDRDGYPFWPFWPQVNTWWQVRDRQNLFFVHMKNLESDLENQLKQLARFLEVEIEDATWLKTLDHCSFDYISNNAQGLFSLINVSFLDGKRALLDRGRSGSWSHELTAADIRKYELQAHTRLAPQCAHWLATGRRR